MTLSISEHMLYNTLKLMPSKNKKLNGSSGTGFFFSFDLHSEKFAPAIITNKHVIREADGIYTKFHLVKEGIPTGKFTDI